jgi:FixJ family two-component response regulator
MAARQSCREAPATIFVVDDDAGARNSLCFLLKSVGLSAVAYGSAQEFLAAYDANTPGCLVLDVRMPSMSGLELQLELNRRGAIIPVIFVTGHGDVPMAVEAIKDGAFDFVQKPYREQELLERVQRALAADKSNRASMQERDRIRARLATLTPREREVFKLMTLGKPNKVMAADLGLSQRTVEIHRAHVMEKSGASSIAQLVRMTLDVEEPHEA